MYGIMCPNERIYWKELETWPYWEERGEADINGEYKWYQVEGNYYGAHINNPHIYRPVTKYYFYNQPSAIEIGAYDSEGNLKLLGTVSSGLTDVDKQNMGEHPEEYIGKVVSLDCMSIDKKEKTLRHPVFKVWREDKDAKDCLISEIFS